ncbi:MAG: stage III sporulation protein SpoIIIAB [Bacillota bacterium]
MIKWIGAGLVIIGSGLFGVTMARNYARRPWQLRGLQSALQMLETEIAYAASPLPEALARVAQSTQHPVRVLFQAAREELKEREGITVAEAWEAALERLQTVSALHASDLGVLASFGQGLGRSDREEQLKNLALTREQLRFQEAAAEVQRTRNERMWRILGFLVGISIVLVLY